MNPLLSNDWADGRPKKSSASSSPGTGRQNLNRIVVREESEGAGSNNLKPANELYRTQICAAARRKSRIEGKRSKKGETLTRAQDGTRPLEPAHDFYILRLDGLDHYQAT